MLLSQPQPQLGRVVPAMLTSEHCVGDSNGSIQPLPAATPCSRGFSTWGWQATVVLVTCALLLLHADKDHTLQHHLVVSASALTWPVPLSELLTGHCKPEALLRQPCECEPVAPPHISRPCVTPLHHLHHRHTLRHTARKHSQAVQRGTGRHHTCSTATRRRVGSRGQQCQSTA
jgi:hypothetical protein